MARATHVSEQELPQERQQPAGDSILAANTPDEKKPVRELWADGLGRVGIRSAQVLLVLVLATVSVYALLQIRLLVIPTLIALILAAAIGPFVNLLRRKGMPGSLLLSTNPRAGHGGSSTTQLPNT